MRELPLFFHNVTIGDTVIPDYVTYSWIAIALILGVALFVRITLKFTPAGVQNFVEAIAEFFLNLTEETIGHMGRVFFPFIATLGIYIFICNFLGLLPGGSAPTSNINTTAACAIPVFFATHYYGTKLHGMTYIKHFVGPMRSIFALPLMILMFVIEVIGHIARPLTLSVRLFGNMVAKHKIIMILAFLVPAVVPVAILALGVLVSLIQAYVFVLLTTLYLAGAVEEAH